MRAWPLFVGFSVCLCLILVPMGCDGEFEVPFGPESSQLASRTTLTSTSLASSSSAAQDTPPSTDPLGYEITPDNVTGTVLSLLFATDGLDDEGLVIFGNERPDIAPADSDLIDFDLAEPEPIQAVVQLKPGYVGGQSSLFVMLFGYMDMHFTFNGQPKVVRIAMADHDDMQRGDKLLLDPTTGDFRWYDNVTGTFVTERPDDPAAIEFIRDYVDPIRPDLVFHPLNVEVLDPIDVDATELAAADTIDVELDFVLQDAIVLVGELDPSGVTDEELITAFDLSQTASALDPADGSGFGDSGFIVDAEVVLTPAP